MTNMIQIVDSMVSSDYKKDGVNDVFAKRLSADEVVGRDGQHLWKRKTRDQRVTSKIIKPP